MKLSEPGIVLSGAVHAGALVLLLATFSGAPPLPENHEAVPIETISNTDFQQVMRGDKSVKDIVENAPPPADRVAPTTDSKATTKPVADKDVSAPPPPAPPDPVKDDAPPAPEVAQTPPEPPPPPTPPPAPTPPVPEPPPRPVTAETPPPPPVPLPPVQPPPPPVPMPPPRAIAEAETIAPTPPPKPQPPKPDPPKPFPPQPPKVAEPKPVPMPPTPPAPPKVAEPKPAPRPPVKPRPDKPKLDQLARLLDARPDQRPLHKAMAHPRAAEEQPNAQRFDPTDISNLLKGPPSQAPSTGAKVSKTRVAGSETGASQKMAASLWDQLDGLLEDQYKQCWSYLGLDGQSKYVPQIKVLYREDGGLVGEPVLINPPADPSMRSLADSALRAVRRCNPLRIPAQFAPYYDQWKGRVLRFDPVDMAG